MKFIWKLFLSATFMGFSLILYQEIYSDYKAATLDLLQLADDSEELEKLYKNFYQIEEMFDSLIKSFNRNRQSIQNYESQVETINNKS
jgi:biopolymer transport protein ExbB/TolQ